MQKALGQQIDFLRQAEQQTKQETAKTDVLAREKHRKAPRRTPVPPSPRHAWQIEMHRQVHELAAIGKTQAEIESRAASVLQDGAQVSAHANLCGALPWPDIGRRTVSGLSASPVARGRGHD